MTYMGLYEAIDEDYDPSSPCKPTVERSLAGLAKSESRTRIIVGSLEAERRVRKPTWLYLVGDILRAAPSSLTRHELRGWSRKHILEGPPATAQPPFGRVVPKHAFATYIMRAANCVVSPGEARDLIAQLTTPHTWRRAVDSARRLGINLGQHVMWATFHPNSDQDDPFEGVHRALDLQYALGFDPYPDPYSRELILLVYDLPDTVSRHIPTCVEAAAAEPWNYFFHIAPRGSEHGLTQPHPASTSPPRPEVVHAGVGFEVLTREARILA